MQIDCATACVNGCVLGDKCPHLEHVASTAKFVENTSLDRMVEMADEAAKRKILEREAPQWIFPDLPGQT